MSIFAKTLRIAANWPRLFALVFGLLAATGFPPLALWPFSLIGMAGLAWLVINATGWRQAVWYGWLFGVGHFTLANNWIATAFTYQAEMPPVLGWAAVPLLSLYLAAYPAIACGLTKLLIGNDHLSARLGPMALAFGGSWTISEWLRSWVFTGYSWDPLSLAFLGSFDRLGMAMILPWVGTYALSGILAGVAVLLLWSARSARISGYAAGCGGALALVAAMYLPGPPQQNGTIAFTLVQPDIRQEVLNEPSQFEANFLRTASLSRKQSGVEKRLLLWPESGVPDYLRDGYPQRYYDQMTAEGDPKFARSRLGKVAGEGSMLLTGAIDLEFQNGRTSGAHNVVSVLNSDGAIVDSYSKAHLVPYGEYLALRWLLEPLGATRLVPGAIDFIPGPGPQTLDLGDWGRVSPQICYEIIFSGQVVDRNNRPDYIFNPSNDGWFGQWGPPQHLGQARMRAIEEGLPVLRATTTGISAVIDANGVVRQHIERHRAARIDGFVPPAKPPTFFARAGNWLPVSLAVIAILLSQLAMRQRRS